MVSFSCLWRKLLYAASVSATNLILFTFSLLNCSCNKCASFLAFMTRACAVTIWPQPKQLVRPFHQSESLVHKTDKGRNDFEFVFFKWASLGLFFVYFCLFKQTLQFLQQINGKRPWYWIWLSQTNLFYFSRPILEYEMLDLLFDYCTKSWYHVIGLKIGVMVISRYNNIF